MTDKGVSDLTQKIGLAAALAFAVSGGAAWASGDAAAGERTGANTQRLIITY